MAMNSSDLSCSICGYKRKLDFNLAGINNQTTPEPPLDKWKADLEGAKSFSEESLKEVREEYESRKQSKRENVKEIKKASKRRKGRSRSYSSRGKPSIMSYIFGIATLVSLLFWAYQTSGISINGNKSPYALKVGECVNDLPSTEGKSTSISSVNTVDCSISHNWEVIYNGETSGNLIKESTRDKYVENQCDKQKSIFLAQPGVSSKAQSQDLGSQYILPSAESWLQGDRFYSCMLGYSDKKSAGSLKDTSTPKPSK